MCWLQNGQELEESLSACSSIAACSGLLAASGAVRLGHSMWQHPRLGDCLPPYRHADGATARVTELGRWRSVADTALCFTVCAGQLWDALLCEIKRACFLEWD